LKESDMFEMDRKLQENYRKIHREHRGAWCRFCEKEYCADCEPLAHVTCNLANEEN